MVRATAHHGTRPRAASQCGQRRKHWRRPPCSGYFLRPTSCKPLPGPGPGPQPRHFSHPGRLLQNPDLLPSPKPETCSPHHRRRSRLHPPGRFCPVSRADKPDPGDCGLLLHAPALFSSARHHRLTRSQALVYRPHLHERATPPVPCLLTLARFPRPPFASLLHRHRPGRRRLALAARHSRATTSCSTRRRCSTRAARSPASGFRPISSASYPRTTSCSPM